jgi:hypothetical protein
MPSDGRGVEHCVLNNMSSNNVMSYPSLNNRTIGVLILDGPEEVYASRTLSVIINWPSNANNAHTDLFMLITCIIDDTILLLLLCIYYC